MKNPFESSETFTAAASISAAVYILQERDKLRDRRSPLDRMIDKATGADESYWLETAQIIHGITKNERILEQDTTGTEEVLEGILRIYPQFRDRLEE